MDPLEVIYEDNHLLVINKPAGIATMGAESGPTVHSMAADYIKKAYDKPGRVFVGVVSRLDSMTTGVLVLARTSKAASRLSAQFAGKSESDLSKIYLAAVDGQIDPPDGRLEDHVLKDDAARRMRLVDPSAKGSQQAALRYTTVGASEDISILAVQLLTGRKHQIRVQLADRGHAVVGDRKYGSKRPFPAGIALHSWLLQIQHPTKRNPLWFEARPPRSWNQFRAITPKANELRLRVVNEFDLPDGELM